MATKPRRKKGEPVDLAEPDGPVRAADVIAFIETVCRVIDGPHAGEPVKLAPFQIDFIKAIYDADPPTRRAILSMGRKGGKSSLVACLLLNHLCGPSARDRPNSQLYSCAQGLDQAAIIFKIASTMIRMSPELARAVKILESRRLLTCPELGVTYRALSADSDQAHGLGAQVFIADELGRVRGPHSALFDALETGQIALDSPLSIVLSTQAPTDRDLLSRLIDDAKTGIDPRTICHLYTADPTIDPFSEQAIRQANPAIGHFLGMRELLAEADKARRMPSFLASYRNLNLNQRVDVMTPFLSLDAWAGCAGEPDDIRGKPVYCGLDLSERGDLTAIAIVHPDPETGLWHAKCTAFLPEARLHDRAAHDRAPYPEWVESGHIILTPGNAISYEFVAEHLKSIFDDCQVVKVAFDRWRIESFKPYLLRAGFSDAQFAQVFVPFGQGMKDMAPAITDLEALVLDRRLRHGASPVLTMALSNTVIERDSAGNRKPSKKRASGRIDPIVALLMAVGVAPTGQAAWDGNVDSLVSFVTI